MHGHHVLLRARASKTSTTCTATFHVVYVQEDHIDMLISCLCLKKIAVTYLFITHYFPIGPDPFPAIMDICLHSWWYLQCACDTVIPMLCAYD